jgi:hypothetical protein
MKTIATRNGTFLTGSELADAVMYFGNALGNRQRVDLVNIPVLALDGLRERVSFTVGWMTDTTSASAPDGDEELTEAETVLGLYRRAASAGVIRALPFTAADMAHNPIRLFEFDPMDS